MTEIGKIHNIMEKEFYIKRINPLTMMEIGKKEKKKKWKIIFLLKKKKVNLLNFPLKHIIPIV